MCYRTSFGAERTLEGLMNLYKFLKSRAHELDHRWCLAWVVDVRDRKSVV